MGVNICLCNKQPDHVIKDSSIDCYKKSDPSFLGNVITANNNNINQNIHILDENLDTNNKNKKIYKKIFKENRRIPNPNNLELLFTNNNNNNFNQTITDETYIKKVIKIQNYFREFLKIKTEKKEMEKLEKLEDEISLRINLEMAETVFSSNSLRNSHLSQERTNNNQKGIKYNNKIIVDDSNAMVPFNMRNKLKMNYKYSGYTKKQYKKRKTVSSGYNFNSIEKKEDIENEEKFGITKQGFGKFIFNDGTEFCGIFNDDILQNYGKYSNINQKNKDNLNKNDKEIIITDNINYEEFICEYKDYLSDGFGIYKNYITNLVITGIFDYKGISGIGIEVSAEGGYTYEGEFNDNKKEGYGTIIWEDGNKYQGEFKNNQLNGYGLIEYPGKKYYQGEIKNGRMDGFGEFFWNEDKKYIGNYKNDKRNGFGVFIFKSNLNNNYQNSIIMNEAESNCNNQINNNYSAYIGFWKDGNMDGFGMKVNKLGINFGLWENGNKRKDFESNYALKTYIKWIDKKYIKFFSGNQGEIFIFLDKCININNEICPINQDT